MAKSVLNLYLQKVKAGDEAYLQKLCERLAERLIHVPIAQPQTVAERDGSGTKVNVVQINEGDRSLIPLFTSENLLKSWCESKGEAAESIALLGADFCAVLGNNSWLVINPGSPESCELQPKVVDMIARSVPDDAPPVRRDAAEKIFGLTEDQVIEDISDVDAVRNQDGLGDGIQVESVSGSKLMVRDISSTTSAHAIENDDSKQPKKRSFLSFLKFSR